MARNKEKWSTEVTKHSDALELEEHVFEKDDPKEIAASLKRSAEKSRRRKAQPFQSAIRQSRRKNLPARRKKVLEDAKDELRRAFGKPEAS